MAHSLQPLTGGPRSHLTEAEVLASLRVDHGPKVRWGVEVIDPETLQPTGAMVDALDGGIDWSYRASDSLVGGNSGDAAVRRTARIRVRNNPAFNYLSSFYKPWVEMQSPTTGAWVRWNLGAFVPTLPPLDDDGLLLTRELELADKTHIYQTYTLSEPLEIKADTHVGEWIRNDLQLRFKEPDVSRVGPPATEPSRVLEELLVFEEGESILSVYNTLLNYVGYEQLYVDEDGYPVSETMTDLMEHEHDAVLDPSDPNSDMFSKTQARIESVNPDLPNVIKFVARRGPSLPEEGNGIRTVTNPDTGPGSQQQRGRTVMLREEVDSLSQEELDTIARTRSQYLFAGGGLRMSLQVALYPRLSDQNILRVVKPRLGVEGRWLVTSWSLSLGRMDSESQALMSVEAERLSGATFLSEAPVSTGAYGTVPFAKQSFGSTQPPA